jgi:hypothetical protein
MDNEYKNDESQNRDIIDNQGINLGFNNFYEFDNNEIKKSPMEEVEKRLTAPRTNNNQQGHSQLLVTNNNNKQQPQSLHEQSTINEWSNESINEESNKKKFSSVLTANNAFMTNHTNENRDNLPDNCPICRTPPIPAMRLENCCHVICKGCYQCLLEKTNTNFNSLFSCPMCREEIVVYPEEAKDIDELVKKILGNDEYERRLRDAKCKEERRIKREVLREDPLALFSPEDRELHLKNQKKKIEEEKGRNKEEENLEKEKKYLIYVSYACILAIMVCLLSIISIAITNPGFMATTLIITIIAIVSGTIIYGIINKDFVISRNRKDILNDTLLDGGMRVNNIYQRREQRTFRIFQHYNNQLN